MGNENPGIQQERTEEHVETRTETTETQAAGEAGQTVPTGTDGEALEHHETPEKDN